MHIAFLGDSLTEGWPGAAYFPLLQARLPQHELLNLGRAGDTVADLLRRARHRGMARVGLAFVWVGVNDAVMGAVGDGNGRGWAERLTRIADDYEALVKWTAARASRVVCVRPIVLEADGSIWETYADEIGDAIVALADMHERVRVLDPRAALAAAEGAGEGPFTTDGVHFTDAGAAVVAASFAEVVDESERGEPAAADTGG